MLYCLCCMCGRWAKCAGRMHERFACAVGCLALAPPPASWLCATGRSSTRDVSLIVSAHDGDDDNDCISCGLNTSNPARPVVSRGSTGANGPRLGGALAVT